MENFETEGLLAHCRQLIEGRLGWGNSSVWTSEDFEILSEKVFEKTQVRLSVTTLKRIWGKVKYESSPNVATLNALVQFVDYDNWREFRQKANVLGVVQFGEPVPAISGASQVPGPPPKAKSRSSLLLIAPVLVALLVIASFLMTSKKGQEAPAPVEEKPMPEPLFESKKTTDDLPNSVIFHYDVSMYNSDSVYIQQNWDPNRREKVDGKGNYHTSIYYYPGYFGARLIVDGEVKAYSAVFIKSQGWKGMIDQAPVPIYLSEQEIRQNGRMGATADLFRDKLNSKVFNETWVTFHNVREFHGVAGNDFFLETSLQNTSSVEESVCRNVIVYVLGTQSAVIIPLSDKGCVSNLRLLTGNNWIDGKVDDLSAFGCDFSKLQKLACRVHGSKIEISLNEEVVFRSDDAGSIGDVIGLRYAFEGPGEVKEVKLGNSGKVVYEEVF